MSQHYLPGVKGRVGAEASRTYDGRAEVARARRLANIRDIIDTILLLAVDWLFITWESVHIPLLTRWQSLIVLLVVHALFGVYVLATRIIPAIRARRIASTWERQERERFKK